MLKLKHKSILTVLAVIAVMLPFISCEKSGYLTTVSFPAEGGVFEGVWDRYIYAVVIRDSKGNWKGGDDNLENGQYPDTTRITLQWLTFEQVKGRDEIILKAEPNHSGQQRELYLDGMVENAGRSVTVIQKP
mgnify:CR=1 FL=1